MTDAERLAEAVEDGSAKGNEVDAQPGAEGGGDRPLEIDDPETWGARACP